MSPFYLLLLVKLCRFEDPGFLWPVKDDSSRIYEESVELTFRIVLLFSLLVLGIEVTEKYWLYIYVGMHTLLYKEEYI